MISAYTLADLYVKEVKKKKNLNKNTLVLCVKI